MDSVVESAFLTLIEERSSTILSKSNLKEHREKRTEAWIWIAQQLLVVTGKEFTAVQLQKKWNNIQQRLKDRFRDGKKTGGGPPTNLSDNDQQTWRIMGERNPKVNKYQLN